MPPAYTGSPYRPKLSNVCPAASHGAPVTLSTGFLTQSAYTLCESELEVIHHGLPSASRLSHRPPTVEVIQSKPPKLRYDSGG
jgi:hypothetical protein